MSQVDLIADYQVMKALSRGRVQTFLVRSVTALGRKPTLANGWSRPISDIRDPTWNRPRSSGEWVSVSRMRTTYTHFSANDNAVNSPRPCVLGVRKCRSQN
jgi:hypothetical protein